jgi:hypothetical protein
VSNTEGQVSQVAEGALNVGIRPMSVGQRASHQSSYEQDEHSDLVEVQDVAVGLKPGSAWEATTDQKYGTDEDAQEQAEEQNILGTTALTDVEEFYMSDDEGADTLFSLDTSPARVQPPSQDMVATTLPWIDDAAVAAAPQPEAPVPALSLDVLGLAAAPDQGLRWKDGAAAAAPSLVAGVEEQEWAGMQGSTAQSLDASAASIDEIADAIHAQDPLSARQPEGAGAAVMAFGEMYTAGNLAGSPAAAPGNGQVSPGPAPAAGGPGQAPDPCAAALNIPKVKLLGCAGSLSLVSLIVLTIGWSAECDAILAVCLSGGHHVPE